jgi:hypothetical protein
MAKRADKAERGKKKSEERDLWSLLYALCLKYLDGVLNS